MITHGNSPKGAQTPTYRSWSAMKNRCLNPSAEKWADYGGRGITVCGRWLRFENFLSDMEERPTLRHSIERRDNDGNYEPGNCRWATTTEQARNQRKTIRLTYQGREMSLTEACEIAGVVPSTARSRIYAGCPFDQERGR